MNKKQSIKENQLEDLKVNANINNITKKEEFMRNLADNSELLEHFSNDRLEIILEYYLNENQKKRVILERLKT
ncbi:MAG: hypothetical protein HFJ17_01560 [Clostridia bacterium]|nr:hypothetical protein [Clostridia bacterium]